MVGLRILDFASIWPKVENCLIINNKPIFFGVRLRIFIHLSLGTKKLGCNHDFLHTNQFYFLSAKQG